MKVYLSPHHTHVRRTLKRCQSERSPLFASLRFGLFSAPSRVHSFVFFLMNTWVCVCVKINTTHTWWFERVELIFTRKQTQISSFQPVSFPHFWTTVKHVRTKRRSFVDTSRIVGYVVSSVYTTVLRSTPQRLIQILMREFCHWF